MTHTATTPPDEPTGSPTVHVPDERAGYLLILSSLVLNNMRRIEGWLLREQHATYGLAASRIVLGIALLGIWLSNASDRQRIWGASAVWVQREFTPEPFPLVNRIGQLSAAEFDVVYAASVLLTVAFVAGWRVRIVTPVLAVLSTAIIGQAPAVMGNAGDALIRVALVLMCLMNTAEHWSLDRRRLNQRRSAQRQARGLRAVSPQWLNNAVHNATLVAFIANVCLIYMAAGMFKLQGEYWQEGTALYYPLQLPGYRPFPFINDLVTHFGLIIGILTYLTIIAQLFFAPLLLHPIGRRIALTMVMLLHVGIGVLMALPFFSLAMISADLVLISSTTYLALQSRLSPYVRRFDTARIRTPIAGQAKS